MAGGRIRTIKPELLEDEKVGVLSSDQFRLFIGVILLADDHGNFRANTVWLNGQVFWGQTLASPRESVANTRECVRALADVGLIQLYSDGEQQYGHITNWTKHQKIDRPSKPKLPLPTPENIEKKLDVGQHREPSRVPIEPSTQTRDGSGSGSGSGSGPGPGSLHSTLHVEVPALVEEVPVSETKPKRSRTKPTETSSEHSQVVAVWFQLFEKAKGTKPVFNGGKDGRAVKALLAAFGNDVDKIARVFQNAFADAWWTQHKASLADIAANPNRFLTAQVLPFDRKKPVVQTGGWKMDDEENERKLKELFGDSHDRI